MPRGWGWLENGRSGVWKGRRDCWSRRARRRKGADACWPAAAREPGNAGHFYWFQPSSEIRRAGQPDGRIGESDRVCNRQRPLPPWTDSADLVAFSGGGIGSALLLPMIGFQILFGAFGNGFGVGSGCKPNFWRSARSDRGSSHRCPRVRVKLVWDVFEFGSGLRGIW